MTTDELQEIIDEVQAMALAMETDKYLADRLRELANFAAHSAAEVEYNEL